MKAQFKQIINQFQKIIKIKFKEYQRAKLYKKGKKLKKERKKLKKLTIAVIHL